MRGRDGGGASDRTGEGPWASLAGMGEVVGLGEGKGWGGDMG